MGQLKIAVPSKGRLREPSLKLLSSAGIEPIYSHLSSRSLIIPTTWDDVRLVLVRPEDIPGIVASGAAELGITGHDLVIEYGADVEEVADLGFGNAKLMLAVQSNLDINNPNEIREGFRIATKYVRITKDYFNKLGIRVKVLKVSGSAEVMPSLGAADAIVDVVSTGLTLRTHGLKPVSVVLETSARLIKNPQHKGSRIDDLIEIIKSVGRARGLKLIMMNVPGDKLDEITSILPAMGGPTIARVESPEPLWEVMIAVPSELISSTVLAAKKRGARDIIVLDVERVVP